MPTYPTIAEQIGIFAEAVNELVQTTTDKFGYLDGVIDDVDQKHGEVDGWNQNVDTKSANVDEKSANVDTKSANVDTKHADVVTRSDDVVTKHGAVVTMHGEVEADRAAVSADKGVVAADKTAAQGARDTAAAHLASINALAPTIAANATAAQQSAANATAISQSSLAGVTKTISVTAGLVASAPFSCSRDTDPTWRFKVGHTSWMNEPLNVVNGGGGAWSRGARAQFPQDFALEATSATLTIRDLDDPSTPLWRSWFFLPGITWAGYLGNGLIAFGTSSSVIVFDLVADAVLSYTTGGSGFCNNHNVTTFNAGAATYSLRSGAGTQIAGAVNSVAATILPHTPRNPLRCDLPNPTIAVGTAAGASIIRWDGVVCNSSNTASVQSVAFLPDGTLAVRWLSSSTAFVSPAVYQTPSWAGVGLNAQSFGPAGTAYPLRWSQAPAAGSSTKTVAGRRVAFGNSAGGGMFLAQPDLVNLANSTAIYLTDRFNTGVMFGGTQLALAESSADVSNLNGITYGPELIERGSFDKVTGWTGVGFSGNAGVLSVTAGGLLRVTNPTGGNYAGAETSIATVIGRTYRFVFDLPSRLGADQVFAAVSSATAYGGSQLVNRLVTTGTGTAFEVQFTAAHSTTFLSVLFNAAGTAGNWFEIDNVSCKEVIGELVTNGKLDQGTTGWANFSDETVSVVAGRLRVTRVHPTNLQLAKQTLTGLTVGRWYKFSVNRAAVSGAASFFVQFHNTQFFPSGYTTGDGTYIFKATATSHIFYVGIPPSFGAIGDYAEYDNISVMPLAGIDRPAIVTEEFNYADQAAMTAAAWSAPTDSGTFTAVAGGIRYAAAGVSSLSYGQLSNSLVAGRTYEASLVVNVNAGASFNFLLGNVVNGAQYANSGDISTTGVVLRSFTFTATTAALWARIRSNNPGTSVDFLSIIVREVDTGLGANLVTNGTFAADTDWTKVGANVSISGGTLNFTGINSVASQAQALTAGKVYAISYSVTSWDGVGNGVRFDLCDSVFTPLVSSAYRTTPGRYTEYFVAPAGVAHIRFATFSGGTGVISIDNVSVQEVTDSLIYNGTFDTDVSGWENLIIGTGPASSWSAGKLALGFTNGSNYARTYFRVPLVVGRRYKLDFVSTGTSWVYVNVGTSPTSGSMLNDAPNAGVSHSYEFTATSVDGYLGFAPNVAGQTIDNVTLTEIGAELVTNGTFTTTGGDIIESWTEAVTGTGSISFANGVATLAGGTGTASLTQTISGLTVGARYRLRLTPSSAAINAAIASVNQSVPVGAQAIEFIASATSHNLVLSVGAGVTAGVTAVSLQIVTDAGLIVNEEFDYADQAAMVAAGWSAPNGADTYTFPTPGVLRFTNNGGSGGWGKSFSGFVVGRTYEVAMPGSNTALIMIGTSPGDGSIFNAGINTGSRSRQFVATQTSMFVGARIDGAANWSEFSSITVREVAVDRRGLGNTEGGFVSVRPVGTVTRSVVATGAELAAYGGLSSANYLEAPPNANLEFGTGDFYAIAWMLFEGSSSWNPIFSYGDGSSNAGWGLRYQNPNTRLEWTINQSVQSGNATIASPLNTWAKVGIVRRGAFVEIYYNGVRISRLDSSSLGTASNASATLQIGRANHPGMGVGNFFGGKIALARIGNIAPTPDQIRAAYEIERQMFQPNAKVLMLGSASVNSLAYDQETDALYVATPVGTNVFNASTMERTGYLQSTLAANRINAEAAVTGTNATVARSNTGGPTNWGADRLMWSLTENNANAVHRALFSSGTLTTQSYVVAFPVKAGSRSWAILVGNIGGGYYYNLTTGAVGSNFFGDAISTALPSVDLGGGWWLIQYTFTGTAAGWSMYLYSSTANNVQSHTGDNGASGPALYFGKPVLVQRSTALTAADYTYALSNSDNHTIATASDGNVAIRTANGVDLIMPSISQRERATARRGLAPHDPVRGTYRGFTTDATATTLAAIPIPEGKMFAFSAHVVSGQYGGTFTERASYVIEGFVHRDLAGNVTVTTHGNPPTPIEITSTQDAVAAANTTAQCLVVNVTGKAATRMAWLANIELTDIGLGVAA